MYKKDTLTDGQGYRTLESYRAVKGMAGEWTRKMEEAYQKIQQIRREGQGRSLTEVEIQQLSDLMVLMQPIKPYMYTLEKLQVNSATGDCVLIPVQHKYAEIVLIPELMQEGKLKDLAMWMENHKDENGQSAPIDLVASTKCVKVGAFGSAKLQDAKTTADINAALDKAYVHELPWMDYRIQSGVPEHLNHAQLVGTQIRKLILQGIKKGSSYKAYLENVFDKGSDLGGPTVYIPGSGNVHLTGQNLIAFYNSLVMANMFDSYDSFASNTATNEALSAKLVQSVISNSNMSEDNAFAFSLIEDDAENAGEFVLPLGEPGLEHDSSGQMFSLLKKIVNKQKIKGGSAVQASAMGLTKWEDAGDLYEVVDPENPVNVLYDEIEMPWNVSYTAANGKNVPLKFEDWCYTAPTDDEFGHHEIGDLRMSGKVVHGHDAREYQSWPVSGRNEKGEVIDPSQGFRVPLIEARYPGILDLVLYRIPTERDYSILNGKIKRFTHPLAGGVVKSPQSGTRKAGFDFDIDKLYFFMREFSQKHLTEQQVADIWSDIYGLQFDDKGRVVGGNEIYQKLLAARKGNPDNRRVFESVMGIFGNSDTAKSLKEASGRETAARLHEYWDQTDLPGTAEEAFTKYLEEHREEYPLFDVYDPRKSPLNTYKDEKGITVPGNSRVARNNMFIDLIRQRLMDPETMKARYTPGGFTANSEAARVMRILEFYDIESITDAYGNADFSKIDELSGKIEKDGSLDPEPDYDVSDPTTILVYNQQNQVAGKLIGIFANQNTNHAYASLLAKMQLKEPIRFGNHSAVGLNNFLHPVDEAGRGLGIDVDTNVAEYLAASVNAVKDPVLNFLNLNLITADAGAVLARIGYTPREIGLLFNQPIIRQLCDYAANNNVGTDAAIVQAFNEWKGRGSGLKALGDIKYDPINASTQRLADNLIQQRKNQGKEPSEEFRRNQLQVLKLFNDIMAATSDVNSFVQCTRYTAANSIGSTWGDQIAHDERAKAFLDRYLKEDDSSQKIDFVLFSDTPTSDVGTLDEAVMGSDTHRGIISTDEELLNMTHERYMARMATNPLGFEQCMMDITRKACRDLFGRHFPYFQSTYKEVRKVLGSLTKYGVLDADTINSVHRDLMVYLLSTQKGTRFDGSALCTSINCPGNSTNRDYYTKVFPMIVSELKTSGALNGLPFFRNVAIVGDPEDNRKPLQVTVFGMGGLQGGATALMTEAWADMFNSTGYLETRDGHKISVHGLAEDLFYYNFYHLGFNFHPTSSMSLVPTVVKLGLRMDKANQQEASGQNGYVDFIREVITGKIGLGTDGIRAFARQYILNHLDNNKLVFTPTGHALNAVKNLAFDGEYWRNEFYLSGERLGKDAIKLFTVNNPSLGKDLVGYRPVIAVKVGSTTAYYMADSQSEKGFNVAAKAGTIKYKRVVAQGARGKSLQYFGDTEYSRYQPSMEQEMKETPQEQPTGTPEGSFVEVHEGDLIKDMFTDTQWSQILQEFSKRFPGSIMPEMSVEDFKEIFSEKVDQSTADLINEIVKKIDKGEMPPTINDEGEETPACPIR